MRFCYLAAGVALALGAPSTMAQARAAQPAVKPAAKPAAPGGKPAPVQVLGMTQVPFDHELSDALGLALARNPAITSARMDAEASGVDLKAARWRRFPTVSVQGNFYGLQGSSPSQVVPNLTVDMPVWNGGRTTATIRRAAAAQDVAESRLVEAQLDMALQITGLFYDCKRLSARLRVIDRNLIAMQDMERSMERRVAQEVSPRSDLDLARTRTLQTRMMRDAVSAQQRVALQRLRELVVDPNYAVSDTGIVSALWLKAGLEDLIGLSDEFDPRRKRAEAEARIASAEAKASAATRFPALSAQYSYDDVYGHRLGVAVRAQATGLSEFTESRAASLRESAAGQRVDLAVHDLRMQVTSDYIDYTSAAGRLDVALASSLSTDGVRDSYLRQFTSGRRTWLDVMNAMREAMSAQLDVIDVQYAAAQAQTRLLIRMGIMPAEMERHTP